MRYFMRYRTGSNRYPVLVELTRREFEEPHPGFEYVPVDYLTAHRWVRGGGQHETPLWTDEGRIRYAKDNTDA